MKQFYIKDLTRLKDYGFQHRNNRYWFVSHRATCMWVMEDSQRLVFQSPSKDCIAIVCEMYKNNVLEIFDDNEIATFNMKVTEEEMKMIYQIRKEKEGVVSEND